MQRKTQGGICRTYGAKIFFGFFATKMSLLAELGDREARLKASAFVQLRRDPPSHSYGAASWEGAILTAKAAGCWILDA
jgi:hypothetical protein